MNEASCNIPIRVTGQEQLNRISYLNVLGGNKEMGS